MEELIRLVAERAHIPEEQARLAVQTVLGFVRERLPAAMAGQLDAALAGDFSGLGDAAKGLSGLFGNR